MGRQASAFVHKQVGVGQADYRTIMMRSDLYCDGTGLLHFNIDTIGTEAGNGDCIIMRRVRVHH